MHYSRIYETVPLVLTPPRSFLWYFESQSMVRLPTPSKKTLKRVGLWLLLTLSTPIIYLLCALLISYISVSRNTPIGPFNHLVYLRTNGVHTDIILPREELSTALSEGLQIAHTDEFVAFGWGDENFYLNTPTWGDLTFYNAFSALFLKSPTLMHVTRIPVLSDDWVEIPITDDELLKMNKYLLGSFQTDSQNKKIRLPNKGYTSKDDFFRANGSYSCFKTCNTWTNTGFKKSGLKAALWTPFDFGLLGKYE